MKYHATITAKDSKDLTGIFEAEEKVFKNNRSHYTVSREGGDVKMDIEAEDATALRATLEAVAKALKIYEDMSDLND